MTSTPTIRSLGTPNHGTTAPVTYTNPAHQAGDRLVLILECGQTTGVPVPPAGWAHAPNSPRAQGSNVTALNVMFLDATSSSETDPVVPAQANHQVGFVFVIAGGAGYDTGGQGVGSNLGPALSVAGSATTGPNELILFIASSAADDTADQFGAFTDASLSSITKQQAAGTTDGNGGSVDLITAVKAAAGSTGTMTATQTTSTQWCGIMLAVLPAPDATAPPPANPGRRLRLPALRRGTSASVPPGAHRAPVASTPARRQGAERLVLRRRSTNTLPPPAHHAPVAVTRPTRRIAQAWLVRRRARTEVVPAPVVLAPPAYVPAIPRRALRALLSRRRTRAEVVPAQVVLTPSTFVPDARRRVVRLAVLRRRPRLDVVGSHAHPAAPGPRRRLVPFVARARRRDVVPSQHTAPRPTAPRSPRRLLASQQRHRRRLDVVAIQVLTAPRYVPQTFRRALRGWWRRARQIATGVFAAGAPAAPRDIDLAVQLSPPRLAGLPHEQRIVAEVAPTRLAGTSDNAPRIQAQLSPDRMEGT